MRNVSLPTLRETTLDIIYLSNNSYLPYINKRSRFVFFNNIVFPQYKPCSSWIICSTDIQFMWMNIRLKEYSSLNPALIQLRGPSWSWSYGSWIYNYLCSQCLSRLTLWVRISLRRGVIDTTLCDKVCQWLATGRWFSPGTLDLVSSTIKLTATI